MSNNTPGDTGYQPEAVRLRRNLREVIDTIAAHRGQTQVAFMVAALGTQGPRCAYDPLTARMNADSYDRWVEQISDLWPDDEGLAWPAGVTRPPRQPGSANPTNEVA